MQRNPFLNELKTNYLFSELKHKIDNFKRDHPNTDVIDLTIGNTSHPLSNIIINSLTDSIKKQSVQETYLGYGPEEGLFILRKRIQEMIYNHLVSEEEIFISDGAKCDLARLFSLFGPEKVVAIQDPAYPAYHDIALISGAKKIISLPCTEDSDFQPDLSFLSPDIDIMILCSPNNPTGTALSTTTLTNIITYAIQHHILIIFDAAYAAFISSSEIPKTIFEIPEAKLCAIEINSFSKSLGFTGMRLGWSVVPKTLCYEHQSTFTVHNDWKRIISTTFNGASIPIQMGAIGGLSEIYASKAISYYQDNARILKKTFQDAGFIVYGGDHAPYLWIKNPEQMKSYDVFDFLLENFQLAVTPGIGFGAYGDHFFRVSSLGKKSDILEVSKKITDVPIYTA